MSHSNSTFDRAPDLPEKQQMQSRRRSLGLFIRRFLVPSFVVTIYALIKWGARVSTRAEVELSSNLRLGRGTTVGSFSKIKTTDGPIVTGEDCGFGTGCFLDSGEAGITLGDHVACG